MKTLPILPPLRLPLVILLISLLAGCAGGGGGQPQQPPQQADPAAAADPAAPPIAADTITKAWGLITLSNPPADRAAREAALDGVEVIVVSGGRTVARARTGGNGVYRVNLVRGQPNLITANKRFYRFAALNFSPSGPLAVSPGVNGPNNPPVSDVLPVIQGEAVNISNIPDRGREVALVRTPVAMQLQVDPTAGALDAVLHRQRINIRNAANNRIIESVTVDGQNRAVYQATLGQEIIVEPAARRGVRWYPTSQRVRVDGRTPNLVFEWRGDAREQGPPVIVAPPWQRPTPTPAPRVPISPVVRATPIPRIPLPQAARPPAVITPQQANPMPRIQPTPIPRLPSRPLPTVPE
ncbi:MAG: hypothetical protein WEC73_02040 [Chthoniobacterales bacterium]